MCVSVCVGCVYVFKVCVLCIILCFQQFVCICIGFLMCMLMVNGTVLTIIL